MKDDPVDCLVVSISKILNGSMLSPCTLCVMYWNVNTSDKALHSYYTDWDELDGLTSNSPQLSY